MNNLQDDFEAIRDRIETIREKLQKYADAKNLKGDEIVAWLGEICCRISVDGKLMSDYFEYDVLSAKGDRISVKARKGENLGWNVTSAIPKISMDDDSPTHLMFIHLDEYYNIHEVWCFPWEELLKSDRFKIHNVRNTKRSYQVRINRKSDKKYLLYSQ
jgi:hypothetical protein